MQLIEGEDLLAREIIYGDAFVGDVVSVNALLSFRGNRNADGSFDESLYLQKLSSAEGIHKLGCDHATAKNERTRHKRAEKGKDPEPVSGLDKKYYCGFTQAAAKLLGPEGENYVVALEHKPEDGIDAHVAIVLRPKPGKSIVLNDRTEAGRLLALAFKDPVGHICSCDASDDKHPIKLYGESILIARDDQLPVGS